MGNRTSKVFVLWIRGDILFVLATYSREIPLQVNTDCSVPAV